MRNLGNCAIDHTLSALEQAIENKKIQMQNNRIQSGPSPLISHLYSGIFNRGGGYGVQMINALGQGREFTQRLLNKTLKSLQEEPWEVVRVVAVSSFTIGLFLSLRHRKSSIKEKE